MLVDVHLSFSVATAAVDHRHRFFLEYTFVLVLPIGHLVVKSSTHKSN